MKEKFLNLRIQRVANIVVVVVVVDYDDDRFSGLHGDVAQMMVASGSFPTLW
jgi:hypothetical protein